MKLCDLLGKRFSSLTIIKFVGRNNRGCRLWLSQCDCGTIVEPRIVNAFHKPGFHACRRCINKRSALQATKHNHAKKGLTATYISWTSMMTRCNNPNMVMYHYYGGRGIKVCERWKDFRKFLKDMGERPPNTSIHRIDNNAGYQPENCKWATKEEHGENKRSNVMINFNGKSQSMAKWSAELGLPYATVRGRYRRGESTERILDTTTR